MDLNLEQLLSLETRFIENDEFLWPYYQYKGENNEYAFAVKAKTVTIEKDTAMFIVEGFEPVYEWLYKMGVDGFCPGYLNAKIKPGIKVVPGTVGVAEVKFIAIGTEKNTL